MAQVQTPRFVIVQQHEVSSRALRWVGAALLLWIVSLAVAWSWSSWRFQPDVVTVNAELVQARDQLRRWRSEARDLRQREATLLRSDQISRAANQRIQQTLAEREQEIAALRADAAFYQRLGGSTAVPKGLNVHSARFAQEDGGSWRYMITLTQNLNRGVVTIGELRFVIDGVRDGKLTTLTWDELHQRSGTPAQTYSFRYFQQMDGSVMLPADFTPQRVRVSLRGSGATVNHTLGWATVAGGDDVARRSAAHPMSLPASRDT